MVSEARERKKMSEQNIGSATRLLWMVLAPIEFVATVLGGLLLYLCLAFVIFLNASRGLFERAVTLAIYRFRVGPILSSANEGKTAPPSEAPACGPVGRGRFHSSLN
jgi:hypothetical protein